jgi:ATP/maltotriose-dependent transcriptional regulator MalT
MKMTDGWPAAVSLACRSGRLSSEVSSDESNLAAYLAAEVVDRLPRELQRFLLRVSVLDVVDGDACSKVDGGISSGEASAAIRALDASGIPLSWLSTDPPRITLHPLLRDFLKDKLRENGFDQYQELQLSAGKVMAARGAISEAVRHFVAANAWPTLARLIAWARSYRLGRWRHRRGFTPCQDEIVALTLACWSGNAESSAGSVARIRPSVPSMKD